MNASYTIALNINIRLHACIMYVCIEKDKRNTQQFDRAWFKTKIK